MKQVEVSIQGLSPLLMHRYPLEPIEGLDKRSPQEQAEVSAYRDQHTKGLYVPALNLQRSLISAATYSKGKGRASLQKQAAACLSVQPFHLDLGTTEFEIDAQAVVVPATKGRVVRYRARLDAWSLKFDLAWDETLLRPSEVRRIVEDAGQRVGLLDFRPERKGPYGRFMVVYWAGGSDE